VENESPIRGITSVDQVALLNVEGTGTSAVPDLVDRLFGTLRKSGIQTLMHTQASAYAACMDRAHAPPTAPAPLTRSPVAPVAPIALLTAPRSPC
jgi:aspartokinase